MERREVGREATQAGAPPLDSVTTNMPVTTTTTAKPALVKPPRFKLKDLHK